MQDGQLNRLNRRLVLAVRSAWPGLVAAALMLGMGSSAFGQNSGPDEAINNPVATFTGLDKITGRIMKFDVFIDETVQFGALQVTPRACYSRPQSVKPQTTAFIEVDEVTLSKEIRLSSGIAGLVLVGVQERKRLVRLFQRRHFRFPSYLHRCQHQNRPIVCSRTTRYHKLNAQSH